MFFNSQVSNLTTITTYFLESFARFSFLPLHEVFYPRFFVAVLTFCVNLSAKAQYISSHSSHVNVFPVENVNSWAPKFFFYIFPNFSLFDPPFNFSSLNNILGLFFLYNLWYSIDYSSKWMFFEFLWVGKFSDLWWSLCWQVCGNRMIAWFVLSLKSLTLD